MTPRPSCTRRRNGSTSGLRGHEGLREVLRLWTESFDEYQWWQERLIDGPEAVVGLYSPARRDQGRRQLDRAADRLRLPLPRREDLRLDVFFSWRPPSRRPAPAPGRDSPRRSSAGQPASGSSSCAPPAAAGARARRRRSRAASAAARRRDPVGLGHRPRQSALELRAVPGVGARRRPTCRWTSS